jgi:hypothetical protein
MRRIMNSGLQTSGDPRATGGFYDVTSNPNLQNLITGGQPTITGGSVTNQIQQAASSGTLFLWLAVAGLLALFFVK